MNVVLLDLDQGSRRIEAAALRYGGYEVSTAHTVEQAITHVRTHRTDAVLVDPAQLDIGQLMGELRARTELPIIVVSEGEGDVNLVSALDAGADDYISKPFVVEVLLARMRAALRRVRRVEVPAAAIVTEDFTIDIAARRAFHSDGSEIYLTGVEFRMVEILLRHPGHVVSREQILEEIWGATGAPSARTTYGCSSTGSARNLNPIPPIPVTCTPPPVLGSCSNWSTANPRCLRTHHHNDYRAEVISAVAISAG